LVGELLKKAREESGKDLKEISTILKIRYDYLHAIEKGDFKQLPEEVYIKGYIREYAEFLRIDPETALRAYAQQTSPLKDEKGETPANVPSDHKKLKTSYVLILLVLIVFGLMLFFILPSPKEEPEISQTLVETKEVLSSPIISPTEETPLVPVETKKEDARERDEYGQSQDDVDICFEIAESLANDGSLDGINFILDITTVGGSMLGGLSPFNYTPEVWVDVNDEAAVEERFQIIEQADPEGIIELISE